MKRWGWASILTLLLMPVASWGETPHEKAVRLIEAEIGISLTSGLSTDLIVQIESQGWQGGRVEGEDPPIYLWDKEELRSVQLITCQAKTTQVYVASLSYRAFADPDEVALDATIGRFQREELLRRTQSDPYETLYFLAKQAERPVAPPPAGGLRSIGVALGKTNPKVDMFPLPNLNFSASFRCPRNETN